MPGITVDRLCVCNGVIYGVFDNNAVYQYDDQKDVWTKDENRNKPHLLPLELGNHINKK